MKIVIIALMIFVTSCTGNTKYGECVGFDSSDRKPRLIYKISVRNTIWSFIGVETIIVPVLWATSYAYCPIGFINE